MVKTGWWFGTFGLCFYSIWKAIGLYMGITWNNNPKLTNSYFSEGWLDHQPVMSWWTMMDDLIYTDFTDFWWKQQLLLFILPCFWWVSRPVSWRSMGTPFRFRPKSPSPPGWVRIPRDPKVIANRILDIEQVLMMEEIWIDMDWWGSLPKALITVS